MVYQHEKPGDYVNIGDMSARKRRRLLALIILAAVLTPLVFVSFVFLGSRRRKHYLWNAALRELDNSSQGRVYFSNDEEFLSFSRVWIHTAYLPFAVIVPATAHDVQMAIHVLRDHDIPFRIRSGGHHKLGYSTIGNGVVLNLSELNKIEFLDADMEKKNLVRLGPAVTSAHFYQQVTKITNMTAVTGFCGRVAESGFVLGGGFGLLSRRYGMGLDNVVSFQIVLANGTMIRAAAGDDLDWALRGAGSGSYGVVTSIDYKVYATSKILPFVSVVLPDRKMRADFLYELPKSSPNLVAMYDMKDQINVMWSGSTDAEALFGETYLKNLVVDWVAHNASYVQSTMTWDDVHGDQSIAPKNGWGDSVYAAACWTGFLMPINHTKAIWRNILDTLEMLLPQESPYLFPDIELWGGAISDPAPNATAFPYRDAVYNVGVLLMIPVDEPNAESIFERESKRVDALWPLIGQYLTGAYVNYPMRNVDNYPQLLWGSNLPKLVEIKRKYDPSNLFRHPMSVPLQ